MDSYSVAISGLGAAQKGLDIIGNNIANAATEGYHRQRIELSPAYASQIGDLLLGGGVNFDTVTRMIDSFLEQEMLRQKSSLEQVSQEYTTLRTVESAFGELSEGQGLSVAIDNFFSALQDLTAHPEEGIWQQQVTTAAETMAGQFRTLGSFLTTLESQIGLEAGNTVEQINSLVNKIAELNGNIQRLEITGGQAHNLRDQRDQLITELSALVGVETQDRQYGVVDVSAAGLPVVVGTSAMELEAGLKEDGSLGVSVAGAYNYNSDVQGGRLGGLLSLANVQIAGFHSDLDSLADAIIQQVNQYHVQGVGSDGSFTELLGWTMTSENLADFDPPVTDGNIYIRVINTATGEITRTAVAIDASADTLTDVAADIAAITGLDASVFSSRLRIQTDAGYEFDFLPAVLPDPANSDLNGSSPPAVSASGIYSGDSNQTFTFTVLDSGSVGNGTLRIQVENGASEVVTVLNVGSGYAAGDLLDVCDGIKVSFGAGDLVLNDSFEVNAFASTDTSDFLAAVGLNTFFSGGDAENMRVSSDISSSPGRLATALGAGMTDNTNALRMAGLRDQAAVTLDSLSPREFYRQLVTDIGQELNIKQISKDNINVILQNLANQQSEISGVNVNDEAAQLLVFQQMFQAMAKYLNTVQSSILAIMEII